MTTWTTYAQPGGQDSTLYITTDALWWLSRQVLFRARSGSHYVVTLRVVHMRSGACSPCLHVREQLDDLDHRRVAQVTPAVRLHGRIELMRQG